MADAAKTLELPADVAQAVKRGERVMGTGDGVTLAAIVPLEELRRLEALKSEPPAASTKSGLDLFVTMAGCLDSGDSDVSSDKYRYLADAYDAKP